MSDAADAARKDDFGGQVISYVMVTEDILVTIGSLPFNRVGLATDYAPRIGDILVLARAHSDANIRN